MEPRKIEDETSAGASGSVRLPLGGIAGGTRVATADGMLPVEHLIPGDLVVTRSGLQPLRAVRVAIMPVRPVTIRASSLAHGRPERDVTVAPGQPVVVQGWRAETLYGTPFAPVVAARLVDGHHVVQAERTITLRSFTPIFDTPEAVFADGWEFAMFETYPMAV